MVKKRCVAFLSRCFIDTIFSAPYMAQASSRLDKIRAEMQKRKRQRLQNQGMSEMQNATCFFSRVGGSARTVFHVRKTKQKKA